MIAFIQHKDKEDTKCILQTLIPFETLKESVIFTYRSDYYRSFDSKENKSKESMAYYQRRVDSKRSDEIMKFIRSSIVQEYRGEQMATLFPSSMILALSTDENDGNVLKSTDTQTCELDLNSNVFVVDGQHRLMGMIKLFEQLDKIDCRNDEDEYIYKYLLNYKFNCSVLVNYDLWEQGQVFVNVNFKQKPVNKSLYYEIFGSEYRENTDDQKRNKIYVAHTMTRVLNEHKESPFYHHIKMLGTGSGYISQAFLVEALLRNFSPNGLWYFDSEQVNTDDTDYFATELLSYFVALKRLLSDYWPKEDEPKGRIICKTTGVGAWLRLIGMLREDSDTQMLSYLKMSAKENRVCEEYVTYVCNLLAPLKKKAEALFGKKSEFASSSGKGSESKLFKKIVYLLEHPNEDYNRESIEGHNPEYYRELIQDYVWTNPINDLDPLGHHYETGDISSFKVLQWESAENSLKLSVSFDLDVTIYLDNEDDLGYSIQLPANCVAQFVKAGSGYKLSEESIAIVVNTDKYYE